MIRWLFFVTTLLLLSLSWNVVNCFMIPTPTCSNANNKQHVNQKDVNHPNLISLQMANKDEDENKNSFLSRFFQRKQDKEGEEEIVDVNVKKENDEIVDAEITEKTIKEEIKTVSSVEKEEEKEETTTTSPNFIDLEPPKIETTTTPAVVEKEKPKEKPKEEVVIDSVQQRAKELREQAKRARLEAQKLEAQLTLDKIQILEQQMQDITSGSTSSTSTKKNATQIMAEIQLLQKRLQGKKDEPPVPAPRPRPRPRIQQRQQQEEEFDLSAKETIINLQDLFQTPERAFEQVQKVNETTFMDSQGRLRSWSPPLFPPFDNDEERNEFIQMASREVESTPNFLKVTLARTVGLKVEDASDINTTDLVLRMDALERFDFGTLVPPEDRLMVPPPPFTQQEIDAVCRDSLPLLKERWLSPNQSRRITVDKKQSVLNDWSDRDLAIKFLEREYFINQLTTSIASETLVIQGNGTASTNNEDWMKQFVSEFSQESLVYRYYENRYPKSVGGIDERIDQVPAKDNVVQFATQILPKAGFIPTSIRDPVVKIPGGWLIRGQVSNQPIKRSTTDKDNKNDIKSNNKILQDGNDLMDSIQDEMQRHPFFKNIAKDKRWTLSYVKDFSYANEKFFERSDRQSMDDFVTIWKIGNDDDDEDEKKKQQQRKPRSRKRSSSSSFMDSNSYDPELLDSIMNDRYAICVWGPDVSRPRRRVLLGLTSAFGIASTWYLGIYPLLLNPSIQSRVENQLDLASRTNVPPNLDWLTDAALPTFGVFMGIQLLNVLVQKIVSIYYGFNTSLPVFIPSIITGMTTTSTDIKDPPKNFNQLFDYAISGPLVGLASSLIALVVGLQLTASSSSASLLANLPVGLLRQSALGGTLVEQFLGPVLNMPQGISAENIAAISSLNVGLHPVAVAGFFGLLVTALGLLPIGFTNGGRIAQSLFDRPTKETIGRFAIVTLTILGIFGNDLFLTYAAVCLLFQQGSEIPLTNEVDQLSTGRAAFGLAIALLTILIVTPLG